MSHREELARNCRPRGILDDVTRLRLRIPAIASARFFNNFSLLTITTCSRRSAKRPARTGVFNSGFFNKSRFLSPSFSRRVFDSATTSAFVCRQQSIRPDERGPEPTLEQSNADVSSGDLSHQGPDGVLRQGAAEATPRFRRLPRPLAEEERVSVRLFKVGFLERRGQGETGSAGAVFGKTELVGRESAARQYF